MLDRAAQPEAPATEFEITPEMIAAGLDVLYRSGAIDHPIEGNDREVVSQIFAAMLKVLRPSPPSER